MNKNIHIAMDLDGCCAQFDERIFELSGQRPSFLDDQNQLWPLVARTPNFFKHLDPYPDMVALVHEVKSLGVPVRVITGRPKASSIPTATQDKLDWCAKHLGTDIDVIVCLSRDKPKHMKNNVIDILVDDMTKNIENWRLSGGVAIHHTTYSTTRSQIFQLLDI